MLGRYAMTHATESSINLEFNLSHVPIEKKCFCLTFALAEGSNSPHIYGKGGKTSLF